MNKRMKRLCALLCCLVALTALGSAMASDMALDVTLGYNGVITYLRKLPVSVKLTNSGADATGTLAVDISYNNQLYDRYTLPVTIAANSTVSATIPVTLTTKQSAYTVRWLADGEPELAVETKPRKVIAPSTVIVGVLSDHPENLSGFMITSNSDVLKREEDWQTIPLSVDTFPAEQDSMDFFDILVVDGVDGRLLSSAQQAALDGWLRAGGITVLGGGAQAAAAFPYFADYSGITAGSLTPNEHLSQELLDVFHLSEKPVDLPVSVVMLKGAKGSAIGESTLINMDKIDNGLLFTAAFSLSEKPLSSWLGANVIWQRLLLQYASGRYNAMVTSRANQSGSRYASYSAVSEIPVANEGAVALPIVILALFVALVGFGSYFLLKKLDKNDWMWATVPALCVVCALAVWGASSLMNLQKPIAVSYTVAKIAKDGSVDTETAISVARAERGRTNVALEQGAINLQAGGSYYYEEAEPGARSQTLRNSISFGSKPSVTFAETASWAGNTFLADNVPLADCGVTGSASWEGTKLVFTVTNTGTVPLSDGVILTDYGFVTTPAVLPGQTVTAQMAPSTEVKATGEPQITDGRLLSDQERQNYTYYDYVNKYRKDYQAKNGDKPSGRFSLIEYPADTNGWYYGIGDPTYIAFSDGLATIDVLANGQRVTRKGQLDMVYAALTFDPVASDGKVKFLGGYVPVSPAETDSKGVPVALESAATRGYVSYRLSDEPVFAFDMSVAPESWSVEQMDIGTRYAYYGYQVELYRVADGEWVLFKTHTGGQSTSGDKITLPKLEDFINKDGEMFARFSSFGKNDDYADMTTPSFTMDGRLK